MKLPIPISDGKIKLRVKKAKPMMNMTTEKSKFVFMKSPPINYINGIKNYKYFFEKIIVV